MDKPETISRLLAGGARLYRERPAVIDSLGTTITHGELWERVQSGVEQLQAMSLGPGDRVAVVLPQGPELALVFLTVSSGATCVPLNHEYRQADFLYYLKRMGIAVLVTQAGAVPASEQAARELEIPIVFCRAVNGALSLDADEIALGSGGDAVAQPGDIALLLHTSGSTAQPKIVPLTQSQLTVSARSLVASLELGASDRCLNMMPLFHVGALVDLLLAPLSVGGSVILTRDMTAASFEAALQFKPTWYQGVPTMLQSILGTAAASPASGLRFIRSVSAALPETLLRDMESAFDIPVVEIYGMTETAGLICSNPLPPRERKPGSVGVPVDHEILILDDTGNPVPLSVVGEVAVRGASVIEHYEGDEELNREQFFSGWMRTGDLGYLDGDGFLFLTGRLKELINRGGEKISPAEIDRHLLDHPAVTEAGAFSVQHQTLGEDIHVAVVLRKEPGAKEADLVAFLRERLPDFKLPRRVHIVQSLPRNPSGKLLRARLASHCGCADPNATEGIAYVAPTTRLSRMLANIWQSALRVERVGMDDNFFELGGDSLSATIFVTELREKLGEDVFVPPLYDCPTIREVEAVLATHTDNAAQRLAAASSGLPEAVYEEVFQSISASLGWRKCPDSLICGWNTLGSRPPVFLSAGMDIRELSGVLGADQPVYSMRSLWELDCRTPKHTRLLAHYYVKEIMEIYPSGPMYLGGYCEGAKIVAQVAAELESLGREVALLFMVEQFVPLQYSGRTRMLFGAKSIYNPRHKFDAPEASWRKYYRGPLGATDLPWKHTWFLEPGYTEQLIEMLQDEIESVRRGESVRDPVATCAAATIKQRFTPEDRCVDIQVRCPRFWWARNRMKISVKVTNRGQSDWQPYDSSGLMLAVRWVSKLGHRGRIVRSIQVDKPVSVGESRTFVFPIRTPMKPGRWNLDVDMAEDGIGLFQEITARKFHRGLFLFPRWRKNNSLAQ